MPSTPRDRRPISIPDLRASIEGRVITPDDDGYDEARAVFVGGIDRRPAVIVQVATVADVQHVVRVARDTGLPLAVRSGGHGNGAPGVVDDGIVLDLRDMRALDIDLESGTAWVEPGLTAGAYTTAVIAHGVVTGFGDTGSVGIGGLTLGGGVGYLVRKHGLTIDDLIAADVVTADGELVRADAATNPDLFWAIRGGGGNFGVATRFQLRLHELPAFTGGMLILPATAATIAGFIRAAEAAPEELSTICNVMPCPPMPFVPASHHGQLVIMGMLAFAGPDEAASAALEPFRALAQPIVDMVAAQPYSAMYPPDEADYHPIAAVRTLFLDQFDESIGRVILEHLGASTAMMAVAQLRVLGGAMARVPADATAFAHRDRRIMVNVAALHMDPAEDDLHVAWTIAFADALSQGEGAYVNFLGDDGAARIEEAYPRPTLDRLADIKRRYDPDNLFRLNQNIQPGVLDGTARAHDRAGVVVQRSRRHGHALVAGTGAPMPGGHTVSYPEPAYRALTGAVSATYRPADQGPDLTYPNGNRVHYLGTSAHTDGRFGLYRWEMGPLPSGPAPHFHRTISESFYILSGRIRIHDGRGWMDTNPGDFVHVPPGGIHGFRNESGEPASMLIHFAPGAPREAYFEGIVGTADMDEDARLRFYVEHDNIWVDEQVR